MKALGLQPLAFREGRVPDVVVAVVEAKTPGCHGEGMELPTSLPASEAAIKIKLLDYLNTISYLIMISKVQKPFPHIMRCEICGNK